MSAWAGLVCGDPLLRSDQHITLVYSEHASTSDLTEMRRIARAIYNRFPPVWTLPVTGTEFFGRDKDVPVLLVDMTPRLRSIRSDFVEFHDTSFATYVPHVAVDDFDYVPSEVPIVGIKVGFSEGWGAVGSME
jgi:hypothetical protein